MPYGLINTIKQVLLREDAGLSSDDVPANNAKDGQVAGVGVGPSGEPGVEQRRKRRKRRVRKLKRAFREGADADDIQRELDKLLGEALDDGGHVEVMDYAL